MDSDIEVAFALPAVKPPRPLRTRRRWQIAAGAAAVVLLGTAVAVVTRAVIPGPITIAGQVVVTGLASDCRGDAVSSDDIRGAQVSVTSGTGEVLGLTRLGVGKSYEAGTCAFPFSLADMGPRDFYAVEIVNHVKVLYTYAEVAAPVTITLSVG